MHGPGVDVRPLRQITGEAEFNEVFFTDVRIPDAERLGDGGRRLARRADDADERAGLHRRRRSAPARAAPIGEAAELWRKRTRRARATRRPRDELMRLWSGPRSPG